MVGSYVKQVFNDAECILTDLADLNICDRDSVMIAVEKTSPGLVLHLAAATDVDRCETDRDWARKVNVTGTENVVSACKNNGVKLVFLSSAAVFDGSKPLPYIEADKTGPLNFYGKTKLEAEGIIASRLKDYFIIRAGWMVGGGGKDVKFVGKIARMMAGSNSIKAVNDKFGSLTYAKDLLACTGKLIERGSPGLYHMANHGMVSRYDIALEIKNILGLNKVEIVPVSSSVFPLPAPRGRSEAMENSRLKEIGLDGMRNWKDALRDYLLNDYSGVSAK